MKKKYIATWTLAAVVGIAAAGYLVQPNIALDISSASSTSGSSPSTSLPTSAPTPTNMTSVSPTATSQAPQVVGGTESQESSLDMLEVKGRAPKTGYSRNEFGQRWADVDHNGCDTRNDILQRDLTNATLRGKCVVLSGDLADPYTGQTIHFQRGKQSASVQIDHIVALSDAWQKGAQQLSPSAREQFANDPLNLLAVSGAANQQKSDGDAATWLPKNKAFRCEYVTRQIAVKAKYKLWATQAESEAISRVLAGC